MTRADAIKDLASRVQPQFSTAGGARYPYLRMSVPTRAYGLAVSKALRVGRTHHTKQGYQWTEANAFPIRQLLPELIPLLSGKKARDAVVMSQFLEARRQRRWDVLIESIPRRQGFGTILQHAIEEADSTQRRLSLATGIPKGTVFSACTGAYAPHPASARLFEEVLYMPEGTLRYPLLIWFLQKPGMWDYLVNLLTAAEARDIVVLSGLT